jgi:hypothetical protein
MTTELLDQKLASTIRFAYCFGRTLRLHADVRFLGGELNRAIAAAFHHEVTGDKRYDHERYIFPERDVLPPMGDSVCVKRQIAIDSSHENSCRRTLASR